MTDLATRIRARIACYPESAKISDPELWALLEEAAEELERQEDFFDTVGMTYGWGLPRTAPKGGRDD